MKSFVRRPAPAWRVTDGRALRLEWFLAALGLLAVLLLEVWQCSTVASLSVQAGRANDRLRRTESEAEWARAAVDRGSNRTEVGTLAASMGVRPADPGQTVWLPAEYLEDDAPVAGSGTPTGLLASAGRALGALVPEATARSRHVH